MQSDIALSGGTDTTTGLFIPSDEQMSSRKLVVAVAVVALTWTDGDRILHTFPSLAYSLLN